MKSPALSFTEINIREMPGFETGGFVVKQLAAGMNIIYGPNASGKSSLSRAMGRLLRPTDERGGDCSLVGKLTVDGEVVLIDYRPGKVSTQRSGKEIQTQSLAPDAMQDRYILSLADLLGDDDEAEELTRKILREASGGYDLAEAGEAVGFRSTARHSGAPQRELRSAQEDLKEARHEAEQLAEEELELPDLEKELKEAEVAGQDLELLRKAEEYRNWFEEEAATREVLAEFPAGMEKLQTDAPERLENITSEIETQEIEKGNAEEARVRAQAVLDQSPLHPTDGIKPEVVTALREKVKNLEGLERKKIESATRVKEADASIRNALVSLGGGAAEAAKVKNIDLEKAGELLEFARRAEHFQCDLSAYEKITKWLQADTPTEDVDSLRDGRRALNRWLVRIDLLNPVSGTEPNRPTPLKSPLFLLSLSIALVFLTAGTISDAKWFLGLLLPLLQAGWFLWSARQRPVLLDHRCDPEQSKAEFKKTGLEGPADWNPEAVETLLQRFDSLYDQARLEEERRQRWADERSRGAELQERKDALEIDRAQWQEELGLDWDHNELDIYLRVGQLRALFEARQGLAVAEASQEAAVASFDNLLEEITRTLQEYGLTSVADCALAHSTVQELETLRIAYADAQSDVLRARADMKRAGDQMKRREEERAQVFELAGLTVGQEAELQSRLQQMGDYQLKKAAYHSAVTLLQSAENALRDDPGLMELAEEEISDRRSKLEAVAAKKDEFTERRIRLLERIEQAEERTDMAEKLAGLERTADALRLRREEDQAAVTGDTLARFVRQRHHQADQTGIFSRASKLFTKFTRGRFKLNIDDDVEHPRFRCIDTATGRGRSMQQLSSGTRVQLLLAVRIAFVENQEQGGRKMPFILDEALAITDEQRAEEIIKAGIDICSGGRQFFYLTAQHDEVGKWRRLLETTELRVREIDLAEVRDFSQKDRVPPQVFEPPPAVEFPGPAGMGHEAYGRALSVPSIDQAATVGGIHLWYLIEDSEELCELLNDGINLWGQLENLVESKNSENLTANSSLYTQASAGARVLAFALKYHRIGRGRPVSRQAIKESDTTGKFFEEVVQLVDGLEGDGKLLVKRLEAGEVKGFRKQKTSDLEQYLEDNGFIDRENLLSDTEIRNQVREDVYKDTESGLLNLERINWLIQQVLKEDE